MPQDCSNIDEYAHKLTHSASLFDILRPDSKEAVVVFLLINGGIMDKRVIEFINDWGFIAVSGLVTWVMAYSLATLG